MTKTLLSSQREYFRPSRISLWTFFIQPSNGNTLNQWRILMITDLQCFEKHGMYNAMGSYQTICIIFSVINKDYKMEKNILSFATGKQNHFALNVSLSYRLILVYWSQYLHENNKRKQCNGCIYLESHRIKGSHCKCNNNQKQTHKKRQ